MHDADVEEEKGNADDDEDDDDETDVEAVEDEAVAANEGEEGEAVDDEEADEEEKKEEEEEEEKKEGGGHCYPPETTVTTRSQSLLRSPRTRNPSPSSSDSESEATDSSYTSDGDDYASMSTTERTRTPILCAESYDHGDFGPFLLGVNSMLLATVMAKSVKTGTDVDDEAIHVMKKQLYRYALPNMTRNPDGECHEVFTFLFETPHGDPPLPLVEDVLRDESIHHPDTGFVNHPLTVVRTTPFKVLDATTNPPTPTICFDAAWRVLIHRLRIRFAGPSSSQAYALMAELKLGKEEDPNALHSRLKILSARVNRAYEVNEPLITTYNAATFLIQALPDTLRSVVQERLNRSGVGHEEFTTDQMADIATTAYNELLRFKGQAMNNRVMMDNLNGFINSQTGATKQAYLAEMNALPTPAVRGAPQAPTYPAPPTRRNPQPRTPTPPAILPPPPTSSRRSTPTTTLRLNAKGQALIQRPRSTTPSHAAGVISPGDACKYCRGPINQFHAGPDGSITAENCHFSGRSRWANDMWAPNQQKMPPQVKYLHPLLLANIGRVDNRQTPLSLAEFENLYCEPTESTQPHAQPTGAQPSSSYHAVAPPNATPETIVHFHSYAITNEDYPTYEDLASADASNQASPPQPHAADTYSTDSVQQPTHDPTATEPRTPDPAIPDSDEWPRPGYFDARGHLPHLARASLKNIHPEDLAEMLLKQPCTMFFFRYYIDDVAQGAPPAVSLVAYDQRNTGVTIARKQITDWPTPITDSNDTLHAKHNCAKDGRRTMLEGTPAPDHPNRLHTLSKAIEPLDDRVDHLQALYHKVQDQDPTLLAYETDEPPYAMFVGVRLLPTDEVAALKYPRRSDDHIGLRDITMMSLLTPVAPWIEQLMLRLQHDLQQPFGSHRPLAPLPPGIIPAPNPRWPGYDNPEYTRTNYNGIEGAPIFITTSSIDSDTNRSKSVENDAHHFDDDVEMEEEQTDHPTPWYLQHLPLCAPRTINNYDEGGAFDFQSPDWPSPAGMIFNQGDYKKYLHAQEHVLQVKHEYDEIDHLIHNTVPPTDSSPRITFNGMPIRCTGQQVGRVKPGADGFARCCIVHRRMEARVIIMAADKIWKRIPTASVNDADASTSDNEDDSADANATDDEDNNAGATNNNEVADTTMSCMARTRMNNQPVPASFTRTGSPGGHSGELTAPVAMRSRLPAHEDAARTQAANVVAHQERDAAQMLMEASYTEEALESCLSASASISDTQRVPKEEIVRLTTKGTASKSIEHARFFERIAICYTIFNNDAKKGMLFFNQRTGVFQQHRCIIVDTGSMVLVMNRRHVQSLGLRTRPGSTIVDTSLGSAGTQTHQSWSSGELMVVASPGTSHEIVVLDVPGISPDADVKFDVLLSVQVMHAMSAGILPAVPGRGAALVYHPHNGSGDFTSKAYLPLRTLKPSNEVDASYFSAHACADTAIHNDHPTNPTITHDTQQPRRPNTNPLYAIALLCILLASFLTSASGALLDDQKDSNADTYHATTMAVAMMYLCSIAALCSLFTAQPWARRINHKHTNATADADTPDSFDAWASYSGQDAWRHIINHHNTSATTNITPPSADTVRHSAAAGENAHAVSEQHDLLMFGETLDSTPNDSLLQQEPTPFVPCHAAVPQAVHDVFRTLANRTNIDDPPILIPTPAHTQSTTPTSPSPNRRHCRFCNVEVGTTHHKFRSHQCAVSGTKINMVTKCYRPATHLPQTI
ncbi:hypothetical protein CYMTET_11855 [Cymbomonas tetramitiformis]|uniref:Uncharacterized protein n=1 Tax=Cymbomonas tetramitiformis TaxID=36881 RepID=A0AAE0GLN7_9CHLO|nr:hypothetical protein CYMTET_11855 [Cymbomonas tetramitiformis]